MRQIAKGDTVKIHYTGKYEDGEIFDSSETTGPLEFEAGGDELIEGVSAAVIGMTVGEEKTVSFPPELGYGDYNSEYIQEIPIDSLPTGIEVGDQIQAEGDEQVISLWVKEINEKTAKVDANHPMAGKVLVFDITIDSIAE